MCEARAPALCADGHRVIDSVNVRGGDQSGEHQDVIVCEASVTDDTGGDPVTDATVTDEL